MCMCLYIEVIYNTYMREKKSFLTNVIKLRNVHIIQLFFLCKFIRWSVLNRYFQKTKSNN